jgi:co-chaperonin GroES (HSP10)
MIDNVFLLPTKVLCVEQKKEDKVTGSGIIISAAISTQDRNITAKVVLTGEGTALMPMPVKEGHTVLFSPTVAQKLRLSDNEFLLIDARDILVFF